MGSGVTSVCEPPEVGVRSSARDAHALKHGVTSPAPDLLIFMYTSVFLACICVSHVCSTQGGQERMLGPLELELRTGVSHHMVLRAEPRSSLCKSNQRPTISPAPSFQIITFG